MKRLENAAGLLTGFLVALAISGLAMGDLAVSARLAGPPRNKHPRAVWPRFDRAEVERVFFSDLRPHLVGSRPKSATPLAAEASPSVDASGTMASDTLASGTTVAGGAEGRSASWSAIISSATLEDEIKALKMDLDRVVTTPAEFAGRGHQAARLDFSLLTVLFAIIGQYDADVRWKENAVAARQLFGRVSANLQAGGAIQVYNESKLRRQDLDDLIRGEKLPPVAGSPASDWEGLVDRSVLMQWLETRGEANLKQWTTDSAAFRANQSGLRHEAELVAALGAVLQAAGMDDADDDQYRGFAALLQQGGVQMAAAARTQNIEAAHQALAQIRRSCRECHDNFR